MAGAENGVSRLRHIALLYTDAAEYFSTLSAFVLAGVAAGENVMVAIPEPKAAQLHRLLPPADASSVTFADMAELGRNPARIMPAIEAFLGQPAGRPARYVGEPIWPGRTGAEIGEATLHEALINSALRGSNVTVLCPYDVTDLPAQVVADARSTHPVLIEDGRQTPSASYAGPGQLPAGCPRPLPLPPSDAASLSYDLDLRPVRELVSIRAAQAGIDADRVGDMVLAVNEVAANTLRHTGASGTVRVWLADHELICELQDEGRITDPLAGRRLPAQDRPGGKGLWMVNQVCDLVELRSTSAGTVVRLHMRADSQPDRAALARS
jgi:anti-sigma regulatory factor (Ser/Thr protein kinase)